MAKCRTLPFSWPRVLSRRSRMALRSLSCFSLIISTFAAKQKRGKVRRGQEREAYAFYFEPPPALQIPPFNAIQTQACTGARTLEASMPMGAVAPLAFVRTQPATWMTNLER